MKNTASFQLILFLASIMVFSCDTEDIDIITVNGREPVDTTYVSPISVLAGSLIVNYQNQSTIDTLNIYGLYCIGTTGVNYSFSLSTRANYRSFMDYSSFSSANLFFGLSWSSNVLVSTNQEEEVTFGFNWLENNVTQEIVSIDDLQAPLKPMITYSVENSIDHPDYLRVEGFFSGMALSNNGDTIDIEGQFDLDKISRVHCN